MIPFYKIDLIGPDFYPSILPAKKKPDDTTDQGGLVKQPLI